MRYLGAATLVAGMLGLAGCGDTPATMSGDQRQEMTNQMLTVDPMSTGQIPAASGNNLLN